MVRPGSLGASRSGGADMQTGKFRRAALIKAVLLLIFIVAAVVTVRFTGVREFLTVEKLGTLLAAAGIWGPLAFILIYAVGVCLFIPGTLLTALGAAIFGPYWGFVYVWVAAMLGAAGAFLIGRYLGREFAASLIGDRLKKYDEAVERNGFATVLYLRLVYFPFTAHELRDGPDQGALSGLPLGHGTRHFGGNLHLHLLRGHRQGGLGHRPVGQPPDLEGFLLLGAICLFSLYSQDHQ